jgi:hypothetical protein
VDPERYILKPVIWIHSLPRKLNKNKMRKYSDDHFFENEEGTGNKTTHLAISASISSIFLAISPILNDLGSENSKISSQYFLFL